MTSTWGPAAPATLWRPTPFDTALGWVTGGPDPAQTPVPPARDRSPWEALVGVLIQEVVADPCLVAFSGGCDSSLVLAAAVEAAQRLGRPPPTPVTRRHGGLAETDESAWQELMIDHLGLSPDAWIRLDVGDEAELLGPVAAEGLASDGLVWPPLAHTWAPLEQIAAGGVLITGEGGDEVLGRRRGSILRHVADRRGRTHPAVLIRAAETLAPAGLTAPLARRRRQRSPDLAWLRPVTRERAIEALVADELAEPRPWSRGVAWVAARRTWLMGRHNRAVLAARRNARYVDPLLHPRVIAAVAVAGGTRGFSSRQRCLETLFGHVLPAALIGRTDKAVFNRAVFGSTSAAFARSWDGVGVDDGLVDRDVLRAVWSTDTPPGGTALLLQQAWLAAQGMPDGCA